MLYNHIDCSRKERTVGDIEKLYLAKEVLIGTTCNSPWDSQDLSRDLAERYFERAYVEIAPVDGNIQADVNDHGEGFDQVEGMVLFSINERLAILAEEWKSKSLQDGGAGSG